MDKPKLFRGLFWDADFDQLDYQKSYLTVIERVVERGTDEEWASINQFYGEDKVRHALMHEIKYIHNYAIDRVCQLLSCEKQELVCYIRKQSRPGQFI